MIGRMHAFSTILRDHAGTARRTLPGLSIDLGEAAELMSTAAIEIQILTHERDSARAQLARQVGPKT